MWYTENEIKEKKALQHYTSFNVMLTVTKKCDVYIYERKQIYSFFINISCFFARPSWVKQWKNWLFKIANSMSCKILKGTNKRLQKRHYFSFPSLFLSAVQQWCLLLLKSNKDYYKNATQQHVLTTSVKHRAMCGLLMAADVFPVLRCHLPFYSLLQGTPWVLSWNLPQSWTSLDFFHGLTDSKAYSNFWKRKWNRPVVMTWLPTYKQLTSANSFSDHDTIKLRLQAIFLVAKLNDYEQSKRTTVEQHHRRSSSARPSVWMQQ